MGIKSKRVSFTFDESSFHVAEEPQGYVPRESPRITDVLLMDGRTVRIPPVQRFKEQPMSDKVMVDRAALARVLERAETYTDGMPCCDFCSAYGPALPLVHDAGCPSLPLAAALAPAPAASSGAEAGVLDLLPRWEAWRAKWWTKANEEMSPYALGVTAVLGDCLDDLRRVLDIPEDEPAPAEAMDALSPADLRVLAAQADAGAGLREAMLYVATELEYRSNHMQDTYALGLSDAAGKIRAAVAQASAGGEGGA